MRDEEEVDEELVEPEELACRACGSVEIQRRPRFRYFLLIAFVAMGAGWLGDQTDAAFFVVGAAAIFAMIVDRWVCAECGRSWK
jgi:ribosomal protein S27AE